MMPNCIVNSLLYFYLLLIFKLHYYHCIPLHARPMVKWIISYGVVELNDEVISINVVLLLCCLSFIRSSYFFLSSSSPSSSSLFIINNIYYYRCPFFSPVLLLWPFVSLAHHHSNERPTLCEHLPNDRYTNICSLNDVSHWQTYLALFQEQILGRKLMAQEGQKTVAWEKETLTESTGDKPSMNRERMLNDLVNTVSLQEILRLAQVHLSTTNIKTSKPLIHVVCECRVSWPHWLAVSHYHL